MKRILFLIALFCIAVAARSQKILSVASPYQANFKVYVTDKEYRADLIVYRTDRSYHSRLKDNVGVWHFVEKGYQADKKIYFTDHEYQADLIIFFTPQEYRAGWRKQDKKQLLY